MPFDFDAYLANRAAADTKLQEVIDASKEKIEALRAYDGAKPVVPATQDNSWLSQLGLTPGSFTSNRVNDAASLVSGASRLVGQVASLPVSADGQSAVEGVLQGDVEAYNRHRQGTATPEDLARLAREPVAGRGTVMDRFGYAEASRNTARGINDAMDLTSIVNQHNREGLNQDLAANFQPNWDNVKSGEAGKVVSGLAGLLFNAGAAMVKNPSAVREYILENAPQLFVGAAGKAGQVAMAASNIGYAVDEFQKGMENFAKANGGALPSVEQQQRMALQAASLAIAEEGGDLIGLHGAHALGLGEKVGADAARTSFLQSMKNVLKGAAEGALGETPTEGYQQYMEGQVEGKDATPLEIYQAAAIGGASGAGLSGGGRFVAEATKSSPAHVLQREQTAQQLADHAAMIQSGDVSSITDPKTSDYAPAQAIAALHGHSQQDTTDDATKQANLAKADEILATLQKERNVTEANQLDPAKRQAHIDGLKQQLSKEADPEFQQILKDEIAQQEQDAAKPVDKVEAKKRQDRLAKLDAELAQARQNRDALDTLVNPQAGVDEAVATLQDPAKSRDHGAAADKVITLAMTAPDRVDPQVASDLAADTKNGLTNEQRSYLRTFSEARQALNRATDVKGVKQDILFGNASRGNVGIAQYRADIATALAGGDRISAYRQLSALQRFADSHTGKSAAYREALDKAPGTQIHRTDSGEWIVATPEQAFKGTDKQVEAQLQKHGALAAKSEGFANNLALEADAISKAAQEMRQAYDMKFAQAKPKAAAAANGSATTTNTTTTPNPGKTGVNDVQNAAREGTGTQAEPQATPAQDPAAAGTSGGTTGKGAVSDAGTGAGGVQATGVKATASAEHVAAQNLLDAIDKGGVPLNPGKLRQVAEGLGLEVSKSAKPEDTIARIREALARESQNEGTSGSSVSTTAADAQSSSTESSTQTPTENSRGSSVENQSTEKVTVAEPVKVEQQAKKAEEPSSSVKDDTVEVESAPVQNTAAADPATPAGQLGALTEKSPEGTMFQSKKLGDFLTQTAGKEDDKTQRPLVAVKDFLSNLTEAVVLQYSGLSTLSEAQGELLKLFKSTAQGWSKTIRSNLFLKEGENAELYRYQDMMQFLVQGSGKSLDLEENLKTAMSFAGFGWVAENATRPLNNSDEEINRILGRDESHPVTDEERAILARIGLRQNVLINTLGQRVIQALGIKANRDTPRDILPKLQAALGAHVMKLLMDEGLIERNTVSGEVMASLTGDTTTKAEAQNYFLHLSDKNEGLIDRIAEATIGTKGVMDKLFGAESGMKEPSLEPIAFTQTSTKNTSQKVPSKLAKIIAAQNAKAYHVRQDMWALMQQLSEGALAYIAGAEDPNDKHIANARNTEAKNDGLLREIKNFRQYVSRMDDVLAGLYFDHTVWKQQRVGIATNLINPQTSKVHRHMLAQKSWTTEVDTTDAGKMDNFKLRVLEGLGVKTDKQANATSLAGFNALFDAKLAKSPQDAEKTKARNAGVRVLMEMIQGKEMTEAKQENLVAAVAAGGENMHSLDALMAVAHWKLAEQRGKTTFTTQLMGEVDGVTNGPMLTHLLLGAAKSVKDLFSLLNRGGFFQLGSAHEQYNLWKAAWVGHTDLYETMARNVTEGVRELMNGGVFSTAGKLIYTAAQVKGAMSSIYAFTGDLVKDDKVTKDGRNIVKTPLTAMVFGSSISKAVESMANNFVASIYAKIEDSAAGRSAASVDEIVESINHLLELGKAAKLPQNLTIDKLMKTQLSQQQVDALKRVFKFTVGNAVRGTIQHDFAEFIDRRQQLNDAAQLAFTLHNSAHQAMRDELIAELVKSGEIASREVYQKDENGKAIKDLPKIKEALHDLNGKQEAKLQKRLAKALPIMHTLMSKESGELSAGLLVSKSDRRISQGGIYGNEVKFGTGFADNNAMSTRVKAMETVGTSPGVAMTPMSVHSLDSYISHMAAWMHDVLNIHDAHGSGVGGFIETAQRLNKATWDAMLGYSPASEMSAALSRTVTGLAELVQAGTLPDSAVKAMAEAVAKLAAEQEMDPKTYLAAIFQGTRFMAAQADRTKLEALSQMSAIDQYALQGGNHRVSDADRAQAAALAGKVDDKVSAEEAAAIAVLEKAMGKNVGEAEEVSGAATAKQETSESNADRDTPPKEKTSPFGTLGTPLASRNDPAITKFLTENPNTTAKALTDFLWNHLKTQKASPTRDFSAKLLSKLRQVLPADLKIQVVTAGMTREDVLDAPDKPAQGWFTTSKRGQAIYVAGSEFAHSAMRMEVLLHEMVHAATAMQLETPEGKPYKAELEALLEAARAYVKERGLTGYDAQLSSVDEMIAYGMTNQRFQSAVLAQVQFKSTLTGTLTSAMKALVTTLSRLLGFKDTASANGLGALITNVTALMEQGTEKVTEVKGSQVLSMAPEVNTYSTVDILNGLDDHRGTVGPAFQEHLRSIVGSIVQSLHGPFGSFKADLMENAVGTPMDVWLKAIATGKAPFASQVMGAGFNVTSQEAFAIEQVEATVAAALNASEARTKMAYRELAELYNEVQRNAKASDFHDGDWSKATLAEKQKANYLYEFTFKIEKTAGAGDRSDYLARFAALGLANQGFNRVLQQATERNTKKLADAKSFAERLQTIFEKILDFFRSKGTHTYRGQNADAKLRTLVEQLVDIEHKNRLRLATESANDTMVEKLEAGAKVLNEKLHKGAEKFLNSPFLRNNGSAVVRGAGAVARTIAGDRVDDFLDAISKIRDKQLNTRHGLFMALVGEAKGPSEAMKFLLLGTKHNEQIRKKVIEAASKTSLKMFANGGKDLDDKQKKAISQAFLRSGAHNLLDVFTMAQLEGMLSDPKQLQAAITQFEGQLTGNVHGYYLHQARSLGYYKATGRVVSELLMMNAGNIARLFGTGHTGKVTEEKAAQAVSVLNPLVSLYALSYQKSETLTHAAAVMKAENARKDGHGIEFVLKLHQRLEKESQARLFQDSPELMIHGYTPEIFNPYTEIQVASVVVDPNTGRSQGMELEDRGWTRGAEVPVDPHDPDKQRRHIYVLRGAGLGARQTAIMSATNMSDAKGSVKHTGFLNPMNQNGLANAQLNATIMNARQEAVQQMVNSGATFDPTAVDRTFLAPIVNPHGDVVNWRYLMQEDTKDTLLERDNRFEHILGAMAGSIFDKETSAEQNKKAITALKEQYDAEYAKESDRYILVGPQSTDPDLREAWAMLPDGSKRDARTIWGREGMFVRKDSIDIIFGYRKLSAAKTIKESLDARERLRDAGLPARVWDLDNHEFNMLQKTAIMAVEGALMLWARTNGMNQQQAEDYSKRSATLITRSGRMWNEVVAEAKDLIVIKTGTVMLDNIWSNLSLLVINGVPIKDIFHHHVVALKGATAYHADSEELAKLRLMRDAGHTMGNDAQIARDIARLEDSIARNPISKLVDAGLMPSIVEDIASEDDIYSYKSALTKKAEAITKKIPPQLMGIAKTIYMTHDTPLYQGLSRITQLSDFVARYTLYQHLTTRKNEPLSEKEALSRSIDSFIMYDIPMHPLLQYADDSGLFMFTKYFLRIQRVLRTMWHDNPGRMMAALLLDHTLGLGPIVLDSAAALRIGNNPLDSGAFKFFGSLDQLATVKPVVSVFGGAGGGWSK